MGGEGTIKVQVDAQALQACGVGVLLNDMLGRILTTRQDERRVRRKHRDEGGATFFIPLPVLEGREALGEIQSSTRDEEEFLPKLPNAAQLLHKLVRDKVPRGSITPWFVLLTNAPTLQCSIISFHGLLNLRPGI